MATTFRAGFESDCDICGALIYEGDEATYYEDEVVHDDCAPEPESKMWWD